LGHNKKPQISFGAISNNWKIDLWIDLPFFPSSIRTLTPAKDGGEPSALEFHLFVPPKAGSWAIPPIEEFHLTPKGINNIRIFKSKSTKKVGRGIPLSLFPPLLK
jgi:hypothetical protein